MQYYNGGAPNTVVGSIKSTTAVTITVNASDTNKFIMSAFTNPPGARYLELGAFDGEFIEIPANYYDPGETYALFAQWTDTHSCTVQKSNIIVNFV
jgi:hypothetical protein